MARATLSTVARKAAEDRRFFQALLSDPDAAVKRAKLQLSAQDLRVLKTTIKRKRIRLDLDLRRRAARAGLHDVIWPVRGAWIIKPARRRR